MGLQLGTIDGPNQVIGPVASRPAKTDTYPISVFVDGLISAGSIKIQISPYNEADVWFDVPAPFAPFTAAGVVQSLTYEAERIRAVSSAGFVGAANVVLVPSA